MILIEAFQAYTDEELLTGISTRASFSKSSDGTILNLPRASRTEAIRICHIDLSSSNLISVLVGWIFTSIEAGIGFHKYEIGWDSLCRKNILVGFSNCFMKIGMFHKAVIDKKELFTICSSGIFGFPDESFYVHQGSFCFNCNQILVYLFSENTYNSLSEITCRKIIYLIVIMIQRKSDIGMSKYNLLELIDYMSHLGIVRLKEFSPGRDIEEQIFYREA